MEILGDHEVRDLTREADDLARFGDRGARALEINLTLFLGRQSIEVQSLAALRVAECHFAQGDFRKALAFANAAQGTAASGTGNEVSLGLSDLIADADACARDAVSPLLIDNLRAIDGNDSHAWIRVGKQYRADGDARKAKVVYLLGVREHPGDTGLLNAICGALRELGEHGLAIAQARRSIELDGRMDQNKAAFTVLGLALTSIGRNQEASALADQLLELHPRDSFILQLKARTVDPDDPDLALDYHARALRAARDPIKLLPWLEGRRKTFMQAGRADLAERTDAIADEFGGWPKKAGPQRRAVEY